MVFVTTFILGGLFCLLGQILLSHTRLGPVKSLIICICAGVVLDAAGVLGPVIGFGQEGFTVTILGAGSAIFMGLQASVEEFGLIGLICPGDFLFIRFAVLIAATMLVSIICGFRVKVDK